MKDDPVRRWQGVVSWVLQILLAALFALQGVMKLGGSPVWLARFRAWGYPEKFYFVVGMMELLGAIALLVPAAAAYGALLLIGVMAGAMFTHLLHREPQFITTVILLALLSFIVYARRSRLPRLGRSAGPSQE